jgi:hypothetical protein
MSRAALIAVAISATMSATIASPSMAETIAAPAPSQSAGCAARYHTQLANDVLPKAKRTLEVANELRTSSSKQLPGHWLFWDGSGIASRTRRQKRLLATQVIDHRTQRMCVRSVLVRGGRIRCLKWKPIPIGYTPPPPKLPRVDPIKTDITMAERRIAARLSSRVISKGAFFELSHGTALYNLAQRTTNELIGYASQPYRGTICSGAPEMVGFYRDRLQSLLKRATNAEYQKVAARKTAVATMHTALGHSTSIADGQSADIAGLLRRLLRKTLTTAELAELPETSNLIGLLKQARTVLTEQRLETLPIEQRRRLVKALRSVEFAFYADYNQRHLRRLGASFQTVFRAILSIHSQECSCNQL